MGIVGVSATRGWASQAHIPALRALSDRYDIRVLSASRQEDADEAACAFGIPLAFDDTDALVNEPTVDLVVITVRTPKHFALVSTALNAGKDVYCEWPLGRNRDEAEQLTALAKARGRRVFIGLQARTSLAIVRLRDLISDGYVGRVLSTSVIASGRSWGATVRRPSVYLLDRDNGATMLSIPFGHTIDALCHVLGEFNGLTAILGHGRREAILEETGAPFPMTAHDQVVVAGTLVGGAIASIHYRGGLSAGLNFHWEINGDEGDLIVTAESGHVQMSDLSITGARKTSGRLEPLSPPADDQSPLPLGPPRNVGLLYSAIAHDLATGSSTAPTFETALARHRMLDAVERSARVGEYSIVDAA